ncbi:Ribosome biogenesis protein nsa1 (NOP7-associated protein 1), variant 2 [Entomophthora muscae]|uniref:Ribosome biogenesis protein nsa1 (NOP7-associated protein 1), variant 2 n=1 Tax=Entomophthora muscae TaxID=34485 RepID=A0ACC2SLX3_9FUNG|nr:Ribosome biogenesis protein nsa1 (NOP7-associated protein 1), variant 2 [Entomophthora muscae]
MRFYIGVDCGLVKEVDLILGKEGRKPSRVVKSGIYAHNKAKVKASEAEEGQEPEIEDVKIRDIGKISKAAAVQKLCWCATNFSLANVGQKLAWVARALGVIDLIDVRSEHVLYTYTSSESKGPESKWIGLYSTTSALYACEVGGAVHRLQFDPTKGYEPTEVMCRKLYTTKKQIEVFVVNLQQPTIVATGGKDLDLSLWDLSTLFLNPQDYPKPLFTAKNVPNDKLDLRVPVWVMAAQFLTPTTKNSYRVVIATRYGQVRIYESAVKRQPIFNHQVFSTPILSLEVSADEKQAVISDNEGDLQVLELEKGNSLLSL